VIVVVLDICMLACCFVGSWGVVLYSLWFLVGGFVCGLCWFRLLLRRVIVICFMRLFWALFRVFWWKGGCVVCFGVFWCVLGLKGSLACG